jgi:hypothetical protein
MRRASLVEQHEKLVKDALDHLSEASEKFKAALDRQVDVMVLHNDRHEMLNEGAKKLAIQARKEFRKISYDSPLGKSDETKPRDKTKGRSEDKEQLRLANAELKSNQKIWDGHRINFEKRINQLEEEKQKLLDQISHVGVENYQRKQERAKESPHLKDPGIERIDGPTHPPQVPTWTVLKRR